VLRRFWRRRRYLIYALYQLWTIQKELENRGLEIFSGFENPQITKKLTEEEIDVENWLRSWKMMRMFERLSYYGRSLVDLILYDIKLQVYWVFSSLEFNFNTQQCYFSLSILCSVTVGIIFKISEKYQHRANSGLELHFRNCMLSVIPRFEHFDAKAPWVFT
jgi:hypothetical protein